MKQLLNIHYDVLENKGTYSFSDGVPINCHLLVRESWDVIRKKEYSFIYYVSSIWYDYSVGVSNHFWKIASELPNINFYFKLIEDEKILSSIIPDNLVFHHLPIVVYIDNVTIKLLSSGPITVAELEQRIKEQLNR